MSNTYFQFSQFRVEQGGSAMKVCTDACVQGAYIAEKLSVAQPAVKRILDIGTGTGLLALMLAQGCDALVDAIEIDEKAYRQAGKNFLASPWKERLQVYHADIREYDFIKKYDFIISNPPFYENDLKSPSRLKNQAMHAITLNYGELLEAVKHNLISGGKFAVLLPFERFAGFIRQAEKMEFHLQDSLLLKQTPSHHIFRAIGIFGNDRKKGMEETLTIKNKQEDYTPEFIRLLKPYYLYL